MNTGERPPALARRVARWLLTADDAERLVEALDDEYRLYQRRDRSALGARLWYWRQVLRSVPALRSAAWRGGGSWRVDLLHLGRRLRRAPVSAGAAVLTLSLTLGAGTAILAVVDQVLLRPLPFDDPDALVTLGEIPADDPDATPRRVAPGTFVDWERRAEALARLEALDPTNLTLTGIGAAERASANNITPGFLDLLGVTPAMGRTFDDGDAGRAAVVVSHRFWSAKLGRDPAAVGREVILNGEPHAVVGVLPETFVFALSAADLWRPLPSGRPGAGPGGDPLHVLARLSGGATAADLVAALDDVSASGSPSARVRAVPVAEAIAGDSPRTLGLLAAAAAAATILAFINLAVLLMVRSIDRRRELAIRRALGAAPSDAARQLVLESVALVTLGVLGGVLLSSWMTPLAGRYGLELGGLAQRELGVSWRMVGGTAIAAIVCALACGLFPALRRRRGPAGRALRAGDTSPPGEVVLRRAFVATQMALAFVLLVSMAALGRSLLNVLATDPGFDPRGVLKLQVSLPAAGYGTTEQQVAFYAALQDAIDERLGGVSIISEVPLTGDGGRGLVGLGPDDAVQEAVVRSAGPGYFEALEVPMLAGRAFDASDGGAAPPRVVITRLLSQRLFRVLDAVGRRVWLAAAGGWAEVIGVSGDVTHRALGESPLPTAYLSFLQSPSASSILVVRSDRPDATVIRTVREEVARLDPALPVYDVRSMEEVLAGSPGVPTRRVLTIVLAAFALLAVLLSVVGLFGVAAHDAAHRRRELALRLALGAAPRAILRGSLTRDIRTAGVGLVLGGAMTFWAVRALGDLLYDTDPASLLGIAAVVGAALLVAAAVAVAPVAVRAARSDPLTALRSE